jgi:hypothetical protein
MSPRITTAVAVRVLAQLRHDPRTVALLIVVPALLVTLLRYLFDARPQQFDAVGAPLVGLFPLISMFLVTSITVLRERTTGTLERLLTMPLAKLDILGGYGAAPDRRRRSARRRRHGRRRGDPRCDRPRARARGGDAAAPHRLTGVGAQQGEDRVRVRVGLEDRMEDVLGAPVADDERQAAVELPSGGGEGRPSGSATAGRPALILRPRQSPLAAAEHAEHLDVGGFVGAVVEVLVAALAEEPDVAALVARPVVGVRPVGGVAVVVVAHRLDPARAAPWRAERSPLATLKAIVST